MNFLLNRIWDKWTKVLINVYQAVHEQLQNNGIHDYQELLFPLYLSIWDQFFCSLDLQDWKSALPNGTFPVTICWFHHWDL